MSWLDIGLDQMSLASLIIAHRAMLVDNAIVMAESIMVQDGGGPPARGSSGRVGSRVARPASDLVADHRGGVPCRSRLAQSTTGEYTAPLFKVITIALLSSWLLALTMTPLLCVLVSQGPAAGGGRTVRRALLPSVPGPAGRLPAASRADPRSSGRGLPAGDAGTSDHPQHLFPVLGQGDLHGDLRAAGRHLHRADDGGGRGGRPIHLLGAARGGAGEAAEGGHQLGDLRRATADRASTCRTARNRPTRSSPSRC